MDVNFAGIVDLLFLIPCDFIDLEILKIIIVNYARFPKSGHNY